jgi:ketosteroid isomerase-like protein
MSQENVDAVGRVLEAGNRGDVEALLQELHPEVEWHAVLPVLLVGKATVYRGHDGVRDLFREADELLSEVRYEVSQIRDLDDRVVAYGHIRTRAPESGAESQSPLGYVFEFKDGKVIRMRSYPYPEEALDASGLSE